MNIKLDIIITALVIGVSLIICTFVAGGALTAMTGKSAQIREQQLKNDAVDACAKVAVAQYKNKDGADITEPFKPTYVACLKDKGYQSTMTQ